MELSLLPTVQLVNEKDAAKILAVSVAALRRWRREKRGPTFTHCERCVRYSLADITQFVQASRRKADCHA
jgi:hypothetical protein